MAAEYWNMRAKQVKKDTYLREFNVLSDPFNTARTEWRCQGLVNPVKELKLSATVSAYVRQRPNRYFRRSFENACKLINLQDFTMHGSQAHRSPTHMLMAGVDIRTIMEIIGHTTLEMLTKYTHLATEHKRSAVKRIRGLGK